MSSLILLQYIVCCCFCKIVKIGLCNLFCEKTFGKISASLRDELHDITQQTTQYYIYQDIANILNQNTFIFSHFSPSVNIFYLTFCYFLFYEMYKTLGFLKLVLKRTKYLFDHFSQKVFRGFRSYV